MRYYRINGLLLIMTLICISCDQTFNSSVDERRNEQKEKFPTLLDAVKAAPLSHVVMLENEDVRVLRVKIGPGEKEPMHHHSMKSVMYVEQRSRIRYYNDQDSIVFESPPDQDFSDPPMPNWMEPEGIHAIENIDTLEFIALRVELKN